MFVKAEWNATNHIDIDTNEILSEALTESSQHQDNHIEHQEELIHEDRPIQQG